MGADRDREREEIKKRRRIERKHILHEENEEE